MKVLAILLIILSFLTGAFLASLHPTEMNWTYMVPTLAVGAIGLFLYKRSVHSEASASGKLSNNISILQNSLANIVANLEKLNSSKDDLPVYEARFEIDRHFRDDLTNFAEARESMMHVFGLQNYADVMSNFAAGERYINRVWSASTDGYIDEVKAYLEKALTQFHTAKDHFDELNTQHSG